MTGQGKDGPPAGRFRVDQLAERAGISVDLLRSYQSRGLLPPPHHEGRVAWYGRAHLDRLRRIRDMKERGWSIRTIAEAFSREVGAAGAEEGADGAPLPSGPFELAELATRTGVPAALLRSFAASGLLRPRPGEAGRFTDADVHAVRALLALVGGGVPMEEFMAVANVQLAAATEVAEGTFDLFLRYLRAPLLERHLPPATEADRITEGLQLLLQSVGTLVAYNFQRTILEVAQRYLAEHGTPAEQAALAETAIPLNR